METNHTTQTICVLAVHSYASMLPWITGLHRHFNAPPEPLVSVAQAFLYVFVRFCYNFRSLVQRSQTMYFDSSFPTLQASTFGDPSIHPKLPSLLTLPKLESNTCTRQTVEAKDQDQSTRIRGSLFLEILRKTISRLLWLAFDSFDSFDIDLNFLSADRWTFRLCLWDSHFAVSGDGGDGDIITSRSKARFAFAWTLDLPEIRWKFV